VLQPYVPWKCPNGLACHSGSFFVAALCCNEMRMTRNWGIFSRRNNGCHTAVALINPRQFPPLAPTWTQRDNSSAFRMLYKICQDPLGPMGTHFLQISIRLQYQN
jgi:hypothetical protein